MQAPEHPADARAGLPKPTSIQAAFRELHGARLHAFALLLTLGDREQAAELASAAIAAASDRIPQLRHPERAAAWLRARVTREARLGDRRLDRSLRLADLNVAPAALAGLAALSREERAGLIATAIERLDRRDVAVVVRRNGERLDSLLRRARRRYLDAAAAAPDPPDGPPGPIALRLAATVTRTLA